MSEPSVEQGIIEARLAIRDLGVFHMLGDVAVSEATLQAWRRLYTTPTGDLRVGLIAFGHPHASGFSDLSDELSQQIDSLLHDAQAQPDSSWNVGEPMTSDLTKQLISMALAESVETTSRSLGGLLLVEDSSSGIRSLQLLYPKKRTVIVPEGMPEDEAVQAGVRAQHRVGTWTTLALLSLAIPDEGAVALPYTLRVTNQE